MKSWSLAYFLDRPQKLSLPQNLVWEYGRGSEDFNPDQSTLGVQVEVDATGETFRTANVGLVH
jgi:hypothetical protein